MEGLENSLQKVMKSLCHAALIVVHILLLYAGVFNTFIEIEISLVYLRHTCSKFKLNDCFLQTENMYVINVMFCVVFY